MAYEVTYNCDVCGRVGGAESSHAEARAAVSRERWMTLRVDDRLRLCCPGCAGNIGGPNEVRRYLRAMS